MDKIINQKINYYYCLKIIILGWIWKTEEERQNLKNMKIFPKVLSFIKQTNKYRQSIE
jgi:hypothetical protein